MNGQPKRLMWADGGAGTGGRSGTGRCAHRLMARGWQVRWLGTADRALWKRI